MISLESRLMSLRAEVIWWIICWTWSFCRNRRRKLQRWKWGEQPSSIYTFLQYFYSYITFEELLLPFLGFLLNWNFFSLFLSALLSFISVFRFRKILRLNSVELILSKNSNLLLFFPLGSDYFLYEFIRFSLPSSNNSKESLMPGYVYVGG